ncbi:MAG: L,D-transpeptidase [Candidatus Absconditabacteria bacterium]
MLKKVLTSFLVTNIGLYAFVDEAKQSLHASLDNPFTRKYESKEDINSSINILELEDKFRQLLINSLIPNLSISFDNKFSLFEQKDSFKLLDNTSPLDEEKIECEKSPYTLFDNNQLKQELNGNYYNEIQSQDYSAVSNFINNILLFNNLELLNSQYLVFVDTNKQLIYIIYYSKENNTFQILGKDLVTTGDYKLGNKYFNTPHLIIDRSIFVKNDWKAEGTGRMGFGPKGSRIRYLGDHIINKSGTKFANQPGGGYFKLSLALHTSNKNGDKKLGSRVSHGCVRVSKFMLQFLDKTGMLDGKAGKYLIIGDYTKEISQMKVISNNS